MPGSFLQPFGAPSRRVGLPHTGDPAHTWQVDGTFVGFEGRRWPVGARGEQVESTWTIETVWSAAHRSAAEELLATLHEVALSADARLEVHLGAPHGGTAIDLVAECHMTSQTVAAGKTQISLMFRQVATLDAPLA